MTENRFEVDDLSLYKRICGYKDKNIKTIEDILEVEIIPRGNVLLVNSQKGNIEKTLKLLHIMGDYLYLNNSKFEFDEFDIKYLANAVASGKKVDTNEIGRLKISILETGKTVIPRTINQANYISSIHRNPVTFSFGPAGTGKTYLAVAVAVSYFISGKIKKIVLTRPAVEAGENLGFLPGDLSQKINPYLRPLYDALFDLLPYERISKLIESANIEIAPLAYMRGRTLNESFIILDEAQNTSISQMKMFLTRLGNNSKFVISGDITQVDLDKPKDSGLIHAMKILKGIDEITFVEFKKEDICRHPIVEKIINAYEHNIKQ
ncbi:MAG: PhoH family protein [Spirochaetota bacterium]|nr:PhoH family protein [Spirochaetota bacterium]